MYLKLVPVFFVQIIAAVRAFIGKRSRPTALHAYVQTLLPPLTAPPFPNTLQVGDLVSCLGRRRNGWASGKRKRENLKKGNVKSEVDVFLGRLRRGDREKGSKGKGGRGGDCGLAKKLSTYIFEARGGTVTGTGVVSVG